MRSEKAVTDDTKSARTRSRILEATAEALSTRGYAATRLSDIAAIAAVQAPAIYYYFDSKDDLVEEAMRIGIARTREHVEACLAALPAGALALERIDAAVAGHLEIVVRLSHFATAAIRNIGQVPTSIQVVQRREERRYLEIWKDLVCQAQAAGEVDSRLNPEILRTLILGALNSIPQWGQPGPGSMAELTDVAQAFVRASLGSLQSHVTLRTTSK